MMSDTTVYYKNAISDFKEIQDFMLTQFLLIPESTCEANYFRISYIIDLPSNQKINIYLNDINVNSKKPYSNLEIFIWSSVLIETEIFDNIEDLKKYISKIIIEGV